MYTKAVQHIDTHTHQNSIASIIDKTDLENSQNSSQNVGNTTGSAFKLQLTNNSEYSLKSGDEYRANIDIKNFLSNPTAILDEKSLNLREIIKNLINKALPSASHETTAEFLLEIFSSENVLRNTVQAFSKSSTGTSYQNSWVCTTVESNSVSKPKIAISRLDKPLNISANAKMVNFVILVIAPSRIKKTKSSLEISRTFGTIFTKPGVRADLMEAGSVEAFCNVLKKFCFESETQISEDGKLDFDEKDGKIDPSKRVIYDALNIPLWHFGKGIYYDIKNRYPDYVSDWTDGVRDLKSCGKSLSAAVFIYFACLLPSIAFGNLNAASTDNWLTVERTLISQTIGGLVFGFFSTQPIVILLTTAPIAIYITIIRDLAEPLGTDLKTLYTLVGLWNVAFLVIYACFNLSKLMRYSTRSVEEVFGIFIACAFTKDAVKHIMYAFEKHWYKYEINGTKLEFTSVDDLNHYAGRDMAILWLFLAVGTVWLGMFLFNFRKSVYLASWLRELCSDYALAIAVLVFSLIGSGAFGLIEFEPFFSRSNEPIQMQPIVGMDVKLFFGSMGLGFCLSLLFFMDQNISAALTNAPQHNLKKTGGYHFDLLLVALINLALTLMGLPWVHGALPHSPLHVRALADFREGRGEEPGEVIVRVREVRTSHVLSHIMIGVSIVMIPMPLTLIPKPVLDGLFLFVALTSLYGNQFFERILLLITEQSAYPPNHYIRTVPQKEIHKFTLVQFIQLLVLAMVGFWPLAYLKIIFPILIMALLPVRQFLLPKLFSAKHLEAFDGEN